MTNRRDRWLVGLALVATVVWWGFSSVKSAASLVIPRDPVEYAIGVLALVVFLFEWRRLPASGSVVSLGLFSLYTLGQFFARGEFGKVEVLSLIQIVFPISFLCIGFLLWRQRRYDIALKAYVCLMSFSAILGLANYYTGFAEPLFLISKLDRAEVGSTVVQRGGSLASGSIGTGLLTAIGILIALGLPRRYWIAIPVLALSLVSTLSRGGIIAIAAGLPVVCWFALPPQGPERRRVVRAVRAVAALAATLAIVAALTSSSKSVVLDRFVGDLANTKEEGNTSRIASWENDFEVWAKDPVFGVGLGAVGTIGVIDARERGRTAMAAESWYLQILAEMGAVGLLLYLLALMGIVMDGWQAISWGTPGRERSLAIGSMGGVVSLAVGGIFLQNLSDLIGTLFWYFIGGLLAYRAERSATIRKLARPSGGLDQSPIAPHNGT